MRNFKYIFCLLILACAMHITAQSVPQNFKYQGVAKINNEKIVGDVSLQISILQDSPDGMLVFQESHNVRTNGDGVFATEVGNGDSIHGSMNEIDWASGSYYMKVELDPEGGNDYVDLGWSQLVSVPYALHAGTVDDKDDDDADPRNELQDLGYDSLTGDLTITEGNTVTLPPPGTDDQTLTLEGTNVGIEDGNSIDLFELLSNVDDADADPTNELQNWSQIPDIPQDILDGDDVNDADSDPMNEIQNWMDIPDIPADILDGDQVDDADADPTNEIQELSFDPNANQLTISGGNTVDLPEAADETWVETPSGDCVEYPGKATSNSYETKDGAVVIDDSGISRYDPVTGKNVSNICLEDVNNKTWGKVEILNDDELMAIYQSCIHSAGILDIFGPNGNYNVIIGHEGGQPNHGRLGVVNSNNVETAGMFVNNIGNGVIFADIKNFRMPHPNDSSKEIWYASLEGPEAGAYERGTATLKDGEIFVSFSDHFQEVINPENMTVMLTPLSANTLGLAVINKTATGFMVKELMNGKGNFEFDWEVKSVRKSYENYQPVRSKRDQHFTHTRVHKEK